MAMQVIQSVSIVMAHCGYEATAVEDMLAHPLKGLKAALLGPKTSGPMVEIPTPEYAKEAVSSSISGIPVKIES